MKKISIMVPCYNEEENVIPLSEALIEMFAKDLPQYDYDITFIDNDSTDTTRVKLRQLCEGNKKIKAIFNAKNRLREVPTTMSHRPSRTEDS